jgi:peptide/nickel transport system permease protein
MQEALPLAPRRLGSDSRLARTLDFVRRMLTVRLAAPALLFVLLVLVCAVFSKLLAPYDPRIQDPFHGLKSFSQAHLLGTDQLGRDVLSRLIYGSQIALEIGFGAVGLGVAIGMPLGLLAGYARGALDDVLMRIMDAIVAFPGLILALGLVAVRGPSRINLILAIGLANIPWIARITRSQALTIREQDYVIAARALGAGPLRIIRLHVAPNAVPPIIVQSTLNMGYAVLAEAALSFLGVGVPPPTPTWGQMLQFSFNYLSQAPWLSIIPGLAIFLLVLSFNLIGDALRDTLDPRLRGPGS